MSTDPLRSSLLAWGSPLALEAVRYRDLPWRVVVVGRRGVGKTTLCNAWAAGAPHPVGLGGVTREVVERPGLGLPLRTIVDTPALDEGWGVSGLAPLLTDADELIWVIDGLVPLSEEERRLIDWGRPKPLPITPVIGRGDLLEADERPKVLERVQRLLPPGHGPIHLGDLRRSDVSARFPGHPWGGVRLDRARRAVDEALSCAEWPIDAEARLGALLRTTARDQGPVVALAAAAAYWRSLPWPGAAPPPPRSRPGAASPGSPESARWTAETEATWREALSYRRQEVSRQLDLRQRLQRTLEVELRAAAERLGAG